MIYRGPCCLTRLYDLAPPPPPLSRQQVVSFSQPSCESPGEGSVGGGAKSHEGTKVWSSTKHSILLDFLPLPVQFSNPVRLLGRFHCKKLALYTFKNRSLGNNLHHTQTMWKFNIFKNNKPFYLRRIVVVYYVFLRWRNFPWLFDQSMIRSKMRNYSN